MKKSHTKTWTNFGRWMQPPLSGTFWTLWHTAKSNAAIVGPKEFGPIVFLDGHTLLHGEQQKKFYDYLKEAIRTNKLANFRQRCEKIAVACEQRHRALLGSTLALKEYVIELFDSYLEVVGPWALFIQLAEQLEIIIREKELIEGEEEMLDRIQAHYLLTDLERQTREIHELAAQKGHTSFDERVRAHVERFAWYGTHHWEGERYTVEKCLADIDNAASTVKAHDRMLVPVENENDEIWKLLALFVYWRTHCAETTAEVVYHSRGKLEELARRWNISYDDLLHLSSAEITEAIMAGTLTIPKNFYERKKGYGIAPASDRIIVGADLQKNVRELVASDIPHTKEVRGTVANKGNRVVGVARIVLSPRDFPNFIDGNILVAPATAPDFVPLMKKAVAIVTDTGGVTSHAAIVSRELGKPCIVGTKIATRVFKDGDLIELDTATGIVRISK